MANTERNRTDLVLEERYDGRNEFTDVSDAVEAELGVVLAEWQVETAVPRLKCRPGGSNTVPSACWRQSSCALDVMPVAVVTALRTTATLATSASGCNRLAKRNGGARGGSRMTYLSMTESSLIGGQQS